MSAYTDVSVRLPGDTGPGAAAALRRWLPQLFNWLAVLVLLSLGVLG